MTATATTQAQQEYLAALVAKARRRCDDAIERLDGVVEAYTLTALLDSLEPPKTAANASKVISVLQAIGASVGPDGLQRGAQQLGTLLTQIRPDRADAIRGALRTGYAAGVEYLRRYASTLGGEDDPDPDLVRQARAAAPGALKLRMVERLLKAAATSRGRVLTVAGRTSRPADAARIARALLDEEA